MTQPNATYGIAITADDKTEKGAKSAEKRLGTIPKRTSAVNKRYADEEDRAVTRRSRGLLGTFGRIEQASARAFGGRSLTKGITERLSAVKEAASEAGTGLGEAATAGTALEGALTAVGVAGAATIGIIAAAGYAAYRLADGWAKGAASIGRTAEIIGVASKQLQEFNAAAERQGVEKGTATSAVAGLSQTLNDARYGRNNDAVALLSRLGVKLQTNPDGSVNTGAMLPQIADALARQNSSGRRTAARILGIPESALPAFTQGGKALSADMKDADSTAYIASSGEIETAKRIQRKQAIVGQIKDRAVAVAGSTTATAGEGALDATISTGRGLIGGTVSFGGVVKNTFAPAVDKFARAIGGIFSGSPALAARIEHRGERSRQDQVSPKGATGVMQVMPETAREEAARMGIAFDARRFKNDPDYNRAIGQSYLARLQRRYGGDEVLAAAAYNAGPGAVDRWIKKYGDPRRGGTTDAQFAAQIPFRETRDYVGRVVYDQGAQHHHTHEIHVHPSRVTVKTRTRGSDAVAVSHAPVGSG